MKYLFTFILALFTVMQSYAQEEYNPVADPDAVVQSGNMRFTVLTPQMIRIQQEGVRGQGYFRRCQQKTACACVHYERGGRLSLHQDRGCDAEVQNGKQPDDIEEQT